MDNRNDIREFLASRRAKVTPQQAGLATYGRRRVPGLRREEVAMLAGVSTDYYARLERGNLTGVSDSVLDALGRALRLDEAERAHLYALAQAANTRPRARRRLSAQQLRPSVQRVLDGMTEVPAIVLNGRLDIVGTSRLGRALYAPVYATAARHLSLARFNILDPQAHAFYPDWDAAASATAALLRTEAGRNPFDRDLTDLVGELSTRSDAFRSHWAVHDVLLHRTGVKHFHHPAVGDLSLSFEVMELTAETGLTLTAYSAEPRTPSEDALRLLASWAATQDDVHPKSDLCGTDMPTS
ncbi:helix-turn-helix transcriptional regulator [Mycobacterium sp. RTGN5]|uniref:helix-turn-helix transcriptional regulator n=1 Tax=Mycobacterium sp. RTGN5 TaxID=3016522 RepID=UPI0029C75650|nr:helix-turn-helix transcriptional regulator [Mycobacterium sp. RTGN5]